MLFNRLNFLRSNLRIFGVIIFLSVALLSACTTSAPAEEETPEESGALEITPFEASHGDVEVILGETYASAEEVALYIHAFDRLPINYRTKNEAENIGWVASEGNLWDVCEGCLIGGDRFSNFEGVLPENDRQYYAADVNYDGGYRGAYRLVYTYDSVVYYTDDHYDSFTKWYGDEE